MDTKIAHRLKDNGFTLIEIVIVMGLLGFLVIGGMTMSENFGKGGRDVRMTGAVRSLERTLDFKFSTSPASCSENLGQAFGGKNFSVGAVNNGKNNYQKIVDVNGNVLVENGAWTDNHVYITDLAYTLNDIAEVSGMTPYTHRANFTVNFNANFCRNGGINCSAEDRKSVAIKLQNGILFVADNHKIGDIACQTNELFLSSDAIGEVNYLSGTFDFERELVELVSATGSLSAAYQLLRTRVCSRETQYIRNNLRDDQEVRNTCGYLISGSQTDPTEPTYSDDSRTFTSSTTFSLPTVMITGSLYVMAVGGGGAGGNGVTRSSAIYYGGKGGGAGVVTSKNFTTTTGGSNCTITIGAGQNRTTGATSGGDTTVTCGSVSLTAAGGSQGVDGGYPTEIRHSTASYDDLYPGERGDSSKFIGTIYSGGDGGYHSSGSAENDSCFYFATAGTIGSGGGGGSAHPKCFPGASGGNGAVYFKWTKRD